MWMLIPTSLYIMLQCLNHSVQEDDTQSNCNDAYKQSHNHFWRVPLQVQGGLE